ncbi:MAG: 3-hydroxyacyl-ACP dehydratase [Hymenobacter sp.]|nr:MAG: 3-hydroxyacyl-ACP dehydratase [Hymenobacter sp.]
MLQNSFYTLEGAPETTATSVHATIRLNPAHAIFTGHFPGQPVVPGVCMLQIIKELLEGATQQTMQLVTAGNIKFLTVLTPAAHEKASVQLKFESSEGSVLVSEATISSGTDRFIRLQQAHYATRTPEHASAFAKPLRPA